MSDYYTAMLEALDESPYRQFERMEEEEREIAERRAREIAKYAEPEKPKGVCSKCGKYIGRGLHFHEKACKG